MIILIKKAAKYVIIGLICLILLAAVKPFKIVNPGNVGITIQLGAVKAGTLPEGIHFLVPIFQTIKEIDCKIQKVETEADSVSKDMQQVTIKVAVNYRPVRGLADQLYQNIGVKYESIVVAPATQESLKAITAKYTAEELINRRQEVSTEIKEVLNAKINPYLMVDSFNILNFNFSNEFNNAIESKQTAQQLALKAKQDLERIKIEAEQKVTQAEAEAKALKAQKEQITPELIELRKVEAQLEAIKKWNGILPTYSGGTIPFVNINK